MGARLYDPQAGRFLQVDPVPGGSCNAYDYVCQDPLNEYDRGGTYRERAHGWSKDVRIWIKPQAFDCRTRHIMCGHWAWTEVYRGNGALRALLDHLGNASVRSWQFLYQHRSCEIGIALLVGGGVFTDGAVDAVDLSLRSAQEAQDLGKGFRVYNVMQHGRRLAMLFNMTACA